MNQLDVGRGVAVVENIEAVQRTPLKILTSRLKEMKKNDNQNTSPFIHTFSNDVASSIGGSK